MATNLDYSPLKETRPKAIKSPLTELSHTGNHFTAIFLSVWLALAIYATTHQIKTAFIASVIVYVILCLILGLGIHAPIRLSNFAVKNGFRYQIGIKDNKLPQDIIFGGVIGATRQRIYASNIITGTYRDIDFELFNMYGRGMYSIMRVSLKNDYPHIVLDNTFNDSFTGNLGRFFSEINRIHLEGNFDTYFKTYSAAPPSDVLRILSPDMMQRMIDSGYKYDLEIFENRLHIISNYKLGGEKEIKSFFEIADALMDKLDRRSATRHASFDHDSRVA